MLRGGAMNRWRGYALLALVVLTAIALSPAQAQYATSGPLLPAERATTESPRTVPASEYRDAYCARWTDGCTVCQRTSVNDQPSCHPFTAAPAATDTCQRQPVQCQAVLQSIHRVCLSYTDGCNRCSGRGCTLSQCWRHSDNYQCTQPRTKDFTSGDITGHWRLTVADGRSCEIILMGDVLLTASCLPLGAPVTQLSLVRFEDKTVRLLNRKREELLTFDTSNPGDLAGQGRAKGYRLVQLDPGVFPTHSWEGLWELKGYDASCDLVLSMRFRPAEGQIIGAKVPHAVTFMSGCVSPDDELIFRGALTQRFREKPINLPIWTGWRTDALNLIFRNEAGGETVFKPQGDGTWKAQIDQGSKPFVMTLRFKHK